MANPVYKLLCLGCSKYSYIMCNNSPHEFWYCKCGWSGVSGKFIDRDRNGVAYKPA